MTWAKEALESGIIQVEPILRAQLHSFIVEVKHDTVFRGPSGNIVKSVTKTISFFDLAVSIMMTFTYSCKLRDYISSGRSSLRNVACCELLLYKVIRKYAYVRDSSGASIVTKQADVEVDGISVFTFMPGPYRVSEVIAKGIVLRYKLD